MRLIQTLDHEVSTQIAQYTEHLVAGTCTHEEYLKVCAKIQGLRYAFEYIKALSDKMEFDDE